MEKTKTVYGYDKFTGEYSGEFLAYLCPVEKNKYNMPAETTTLAPLAEKAGEAIVFESEAWHYLEDVRGASVYSTLSGEKVGELNALRQEVNEGFTLLAPSEGEVWNGVSWELVPPTEAELLEKAEKEAIAARNTARGSLTSQWEFLIDNGYDALKARDDQIKLDYPV